MNIFGIRALWRGLRGKSLTFSLIFAMTVMGLSFAGTLRNSLGWVGLWGPLIWIFPILLTGWLSKNEYKMKISDEFRRTAAYGLIFFSSLLAFALWKYEKHLEAQYPLPEYLVQLEKEKDDERRLGPRGKR